MKRYFRYSVIRFRPYAELGEFANIGVIVLDIYGNEIDFRLAPKRFSRLRHFFDDSGYRSYYGAIDLLRLELGRVSAYLPDLKEWNAADAFNSLVRTRESSILFSEPRTLTSDETLKSIVDRLYSRFIKREAPLEDPEVALTRDIRRALHHNGLRQFKNVKIDDDLVPVSFPLGYRGRDLFAIKPLAFDQKSPMSIVDYGAHWTKRLSYLLDKQKIYPNNVLLALSPPPSSSERSSRDAYAIAKAELEELPLEVVQGQSDGVINPVVLEFARNASQRHFWN